MTDSTEIIMSNLLPLSLLDELNIKDEEIIINIEDLPEENLSKYSGSCSSLNTSINILSSGHNESFHSNHLNGSRRHSLFSHSPSKIF
jgi:hypothetical protein